MSEEIYEVGALYEGENPLGLKFAVEKAGEDGIYNEIGIDCIDKDGDTVGYVLIGLCQDKKDMRVLITTDGEGFNDHKIAVYPMRSHGEAVNKEWN